MLICMHRDEIHLSDDLCPSVHKVKTETPFISGEK
jgi:hypothetical protein